SFAWRATSLSDSCEWASSKHSMTARPRASASTNSLSALGSALWSAARAARSRLSACLSPSRLAGGAFGVSLDIAARSGRFSDREIYFARRKIQQRARVKIGSQNDPQTAISASNPDTIVVRGFDLCADLIGSISLTEHFFLLVTGKKPSEA